jgi:hypothetical protein
MLRRLLFGKPREVKTRIGFGDAVDRLSIFEIKVSRLTGDGRDISRVGFVQLRDDLHKAGVDPLNVAEYSRLLKVNSQLWDIEDSIRLLGRVVFGNVHNLGDTSREFMNLARQVYILNDKRSELKSSIDIRLGTRVREVKSYK